ncbi:MAG: twin-arginine translocase TatA/TatE family subunit [Deltaproteobacteria bacterium]|jgi:Sec-independent protein translocase protein TatA|nr:twin-arginine translocase TatA/TatE family subunit [Deltaproteobacteria bacterium]MCW8892344.1 twin-arginine translocase TatA/TatE family subunit [Deltaproteobacteria bacterium]MCW9049417.1 twin-arginine translocase TatA/TatE family subunit [Deltaproteobacteria bacterium]
MILGLGPWELIILGVLVTAMFGLGRLPSIARDLGRIHGFVQRVKRAIPWVGKLPWLSRFFH